MRAFENITDPSMIRAYLLGVLSRTGGQKLDSVKLYHYSSIHAVVSIAKTRYIWLGSTENMNDYFEVQLIKEAQGSNTQYFTCFSRAEENLAMYKMYAASPNGAMMSISFADAKRIVDKLPKMTNGKYHVKIVRDSVLTDETVEADIYWAAVAYKALHTDLIRAGEVTNKKINQPFNQRELAGFIKLYGWEYEKEVRLCARLSVALMPGEKVAIPIPEDVKISVITCPGFDKTQNKQGIFELTRLGIEHKESEYESFVDLGYTEIEEIKKLKGQISAKDRIITAKERVISEQEGVIGKLQKEQQKRLTDEEETELLMEVDHTIQILNKQLDDLAGFSHSVSDQVKKLVAEITPPIEGALVNRITLFLQESINSLEDILSEHYGKDIRASIKLTVADGMMKTFARGERNKASRGGDLRCAELSKKAIPIEKNYSYEAIIKREQKFFSAGNLMELVNKFEPDDVFYCEYGDDYIDTFVSTIVMPIRIPLFEQEKEYEILGLLCIDSDSMIEEWSEPAPIMMKKRAYHIIADYADSIAILMKEYRDAGK